jgi:hypothetical protein
MVRGEKHAREAFALTAGELDAGRIPEAVLASRNSLSSSTSATIRCRGGRAIAGCGC